MTVTPSAGIFHTGMIVDDIERVMYQMSEAFGFQWAEPLHFTRPAWTVKGNLSRESLVTYSLDGPHHVELVQSLDTTAWEAAIGGPRIDHIGYWADDLPAEIARLEALGYVLQLGESERASDHRSSLTCTTRMAGSMSN